MTAATTPGRAPFTALLESAPALGPAWLAERRRAAAARVAGLPSPRAEAWRTFDLRGLAKRSFVRADAGGAHGAHPEPVLGAEAARLVFRGGRFVPSESHADGLPAGAVAGSLAQALGRGADALEARLAIPREDGTGLFEDLATALFEDGAWIHLAEGVRLDAPIHVLFLGEAASDSGGALPVEAARVVLRLEPNAQGAVVETHAGLTHGEALRTVGVELSLGRGARLDHLKVLEEGTSSWHLATTRAHLDADADLSTFSLVVGGGRSRHEIEAVLAGPGAEVTMDGVYVLGGKQHADHQTTIDHAAPHCTSRELFKGVLADTSSSAFAGKIVVRPDAQQTNSRQANHNLLLSDRAMADSKPELEIFADDVKCAHGATVGQLDEEAIFYLRSRGLSSDAARTLLVRAFADEVPLRIRRPALREHAQALLARRLVEGPA